MTTSQFNSRVLHFFTPKHLSKLRVGYAEARAIIKRCLWFSFFSRLISEVDHQILISTAARIFLDYRWMIPESDCEVSDDNVSDIDDDDDYYCQSWCWFWNNLKIMFLTLSGKSNNDDTHCTPWSNRIVAGKQEERRPGETEKEEEEDE